MASATTAAVNSTKATSILCKFYMNGVCRDGSSCRYSHDRETSAPDMVCRYYLQGCCSYGANCRYDHVKPRPVSPNPALSPPSSFHLNPYTISPAPQQSCHEPPNRQNDDPENTESKLIDFWDRGIQDDLGTCYSSWSTAPSTTDKVILRGGRIKTKADWAKESPEFVPQTHANVPVAQGYSHVLPDRQSFAHENTEQMPTHLYDSNMQDTPHSSWSLDPSTSDTVILRGGRVVTKENWTKDSPMFVPQIAQGYSHVLPDRQSFAHENTEQMPTHLYDSNMQDTPHSSWSLDPSTSDTVILRGGRIVTKENWAKDFPMFVPQIAQGYSHVLPDRQSFAHENTEQMPTHLYDSNMQDTPHSSWSLDPSTSDTVILRGGRVVTKENWAKDFPMFVPQIAQGYTHVLPDRQSFAYENTEQMPTHLYDSNMQDTPHSSWSLDPSTSDTVVLRGGRVATKENWAKDSPMFVPQTLSYAQVADSSKDPSLENSETMPYFLENIEDIRNSFPKSTYRETELCPYLAHSACPNIERCSYVHGDVCEMCGLNVLHPTDMEQRQKHELECLREHEANMEYSFLVAQSRDKECSICMEIVFEKTPPDNRFGLLLNCNHIFCLTCIRKWRSSTLDKDVIRRCPECRITSNYVTPSNVWVEDKETKEKIITNYKETMKNKPCKYFDQGKKMCPFSDSCFYLHAYPDGTIATPDQQVRQRQRADANGRVTTVNSHSLWDFIYQRERSSFYDDDDLSFSPLTTDSDSEDIS